MDKSEQTLWITTCWKFVLCCAALHWAHTSPKLALLAAETACFPHPESLNIIRPSLVLLGTEGPVLVDWGTMVFFSPQHSVLRTRNDTISINYLFYWVVELAAFCHNISCIKWILCTCWYLSKFKIDIVGDWLAIAISCTCPGCTAIPDNTKDNTIQYAPERDWSLYATLIYIHYTIFSCGEADDSMGATENIGDCNTKKTEL